MKLRSLLSKLWLRRRLNLRRSKFKRRWLKRLRWLSLLLKSWRPSVKLRRRPIEFGMRLLSSLHRDELREKGPESGRDWLTLQLEKQLN